MMKIYFYIAFLVVILILIALALFFLFVHKKKKSSSPTPPTPPSPTDIAMVSDSILKNYNAYILLKLNDPISSVSFNNINNSLNKISTILLNNYSKDDLVKYFANTTGDSISQMDVDVFNAFNSAGCGADQFIIGFVMSMKQAIPSPVATCIRDAVKNIIYTLNSFQQLVAQIASCNN